LELTLFASHVDGVLYCYEISLGTWRRRSVEPSIGFTWSQPGEMMFRLSLASDRAHFRNAEGLLYP